MKNTNWNTKENRQLISAILALRDANEVERFIRDLMTEKEIKEFANRLEAASLLSKAVRYNTIVENTGLSSTTIARIQKWLKGPLGGYRLVLPRLSPSTKFKAHHHTYFSLGKGLSL